MITVGKNFKTASMGKQMPFATALALTRTAQDAQKEIIGRGLPGEFTLRGNWYLPANKFGVKVVKATKSRPVATVGTMADWLELQESGGVKTSQGRHVAVPTAAVKRNKRDIITRANRPRGLKDAFVIHTKKGTLLVRRTYRNKAGNFTRRRLKSSLGSRLEVMFGLEPSVRIERRSGFIAPGVAEIGRTFSSNFRESIEFALKTAK